MTRKIMKIGIFSSIINHNPKTSYVMVNCGLRTDFPDSVALNLKRFNPVATWVVIILKANSNFSIWD